VNVHGCLELVDWIAGLEYWTGILKWPKLLESGYSLMCSLPCLGILLQSLGDWRSCAYLLKLYRMHKINTNWMPESSL